MRALCASRPADWWEIGDDGNRLALLLCRVCPQVAGCLSTSVDEHGVIRGGVAFGDDGRVLPICACGYPNRRQPAFDGKVNDRCHHCSSPTRSPFNVRGQRWFQRRRAAGPFGVVLRGRRAA